MTDKRCDFCGTINDAHHSAECVDRCESSCSSQSACSVCHWTEDSEGCYRTSCGKAWMFTHELGLEGEMGDGFRFCPFCGKMIDTQNMGITNSGEREG